MDPGSSLAALGERALLIGPRDGVEALAQHVRAAAPWVKPAGAILVDSPGVPRPKESRLNLSGTPVLGGLTNLAEAHRVLGFTLAVVSLPRDASTQILRIRARLRELGIPERFVPPLGEWLEQPPAAAPASGAPVDVAELIGRVPYGIDRRAVAQALEGKRVLVTGAGGSIGSELVRIAATFRPSLLVLMERAENSLFEIDRQLARRFPDVRRRAILHDVVDDAATMRIVKDLQPHAVFHAAAHKHVPLMEDHPAHALTNNLFGTKSIADAAVAAGAERFVLISSDKAVNPTSVMGATKRLAEMYVQHLGAKVRGGPSPGAHLSMVRFGNVLGSAGSVLPIWANQLAEGGPLTITDPRMTRFFMTIHEAATLVIQSSTMSLHGHDAPVFVLDMGEPIRIVELARRFISLHGFHPLLAGESPDDAMGRATIELVCTGARPGEKLHEELAYAAEQLLPTQHPGIRAWARAGSVPDGEAMVRELSSLRASIDRSEVVAAIRRHVPEMVAQPAADAPAGIAAESSAAGGSGSGGSSSGGVSSGGSLPGRSPKAAPRAA